MKIKPLHKDVAAYLQKHRLVSKWDKASRLFQNDMRHPSLETELLEPHWHGIYSFRVDKKYRALFFIGRDGNAEVFRITNHYKK